ncbi:uncharacterized protein LOC116516792 [Thamnophis elegans]|uniref:uncharacterized protein LOC116516792 n=1 Tax=Thamnophis elegans TaxID=35005 RepID=UPI0013790ED5|nr:uncharacterized protein LOC116516792 [Thamnophis elegans]
MSWALFLSLLVVWGKGATSQSLVSQPPSASVSPGNTVKLACALGSSVNIGSTRMYWYQQKPPSSPRFLLHYHTDSDTGHGSGVPSRFSGSKETSTNTAYVTVSGVLAEDEADYYCAIGDNEEQKFLVIQKLDDLNHQKPKKVYNMLGASLIVLLGIWCTGCRSNPTVIQESSMSPSPGQTVKLSCSLSSGQVTNYYQSWYQQKEGGPPTFLYGYYSSATAGSGDLSRFSASKESSQNKWYLTIRDVQPGDEADYYCGVWYGASNVFHSDTSL